MRHWLAVPALVAVIAACSSSDGADSTTTVDATSPPTTSTTSTSTTDPTTGSATEIDLELGEVIEVRPERVLLAAAIIASGDIDDAVAEGLVTPDEVDAAVEAIANGDLDRWQDLADG